MVASFFVYSLVLLSLIDTKPSPTVAHWSTWVFGVVFETILFGASVTLYTSKHREPSTGYGGHGKSRKGVTKWEAFEIAIDLLRIVLLLALILFYLLLIFLRHKKQQHSARTEIGGSSETTGLLNGQAGNGSANGQVYGATTQEANSKQTEAAWSRPTKVPSKSWWENIRGYSLFFPYLWPAKSLRLQITVMACFLLVVAARVVNVLVPHQVSVITNILSGDNDDGSGSTKPALRIPWVEICLYILYRLLQGNNGLLGALRGSLWIPISQYSYQELSTASFEHVHGLSLDFHLDKKTGEVLSALSKGNSINTFLEQVTFQVLPMLIDLAVAIGYFLIVFDAYYALVVTIVTFAYLYITIRLAQWRAEIRREMVNFSRQEDAVKLATMIILQYLRSMLTSCLGMIPWSLMRQ